MVIDLPLPFQCAVNVARIAPLLLVLFVNFQAAYSESINIDCGYSGESYTDNGFEWIPDAPFVNGGTGATIFSAPASEAIAIKTLRFFPNNTVNCYTIPVAGAGRYLIRLTFLYQNYNGISELPVFSVSVGLTVAGEISLGLGTVPQVVEYIANVYSEYVNQTSTTTIKLCIIRIQSNPLVNSIEIRSLPPLSYNSSSLGTDILQRAFRLNCGASSSAAPLRYPADDYDRIWYSERDNSLFGSLLNVSPYYVTAGTIPSNAVVKGINSGNYIPEMLLRTYLRPTMNNSDLNFTFYSMQNPALYEVYLYFAEVEAIAMKAGSRVFDFYFNGEIVLDKFDIFSAAKEEGYKLVTLSFPLQQNTDTLVITFAPNPFGTVLYPIISGIELYQTSLAAIPISPTYVAALHSFRTTLTQNESLVEWKGDPCSPAAWPGLVCQYSPLGNQITEINLGGFNLAGRLSPSLGTIATITKLHLENNKLHGSLPSTLGQLSELTEIYIQNNNFSGSIPLSFSSLHLTTFNAANNSLTGSVPFTDPSLNINLSGNPSLCSSVPAYNLPACDGFPVPPPPPYLGTPPPVTYSTAPASSRSHMVEIIASCAAAVVFFAVLAGLVCIFYLRWKASSTAVMASEKAGGLDSGANGALMDTGSRSASSDGATAVVLDLHCVKEFSLEELRSATSNFDLENMIGYGSFGYVYRGVLSNGRLVACKKRSGDSMQGLREFNNEVDLLSRVHHRHLVALLGFCQEAGQLILVYEFMANGSLNDHLYDQSGTPAGRLIWQQRVRIAYEAAKGLEYLHCGSQPSVLHRDIKSSNILLNDDMEAHLSDMGLARHSPVPGRTDDVSTMVKGTIGYLDPEYYTYHCLSDRSDVYSFGVVLLEIVTGRPAMLPQNHKLESRLVDWVKPFMVDGDLMGIIDPTMESDTYDEAAVWKMAEIGMMCVEAAAENRPGMSYVVKMLREVMFMEGLLDEGPIDG